MLLKQSVAAIALIAGVSQAHAGDDPLTIAKQMATTWSSSFEAKAADKIGAAFTTDAHYINAAGVLKGRSAIEAAMQGAFKAGWSSSKIEISDVHMKGDVIWANGTFVNAGTGSAGPLTSHGRWGEVIVHDGDGWHVSMLVAFPVAGPTTATAPK